MTILVTGATGNVGRLVVDHLLAAGVTAAARSAGGSGPNEFQDCRSPIAAGAPPGSGSHSVLPPCTRTAGTRTLPPRAHQTNIYS